MSRQTSAIQGEAHHGRAGDTLGDVPEQSFVGTAALEGSSVQGGPGGAAYRIRAVTGSALRLKGLRADDDVLGGGKRRTGDAAMSLAPQRGEAR